MWICQKCGESIDDQFDSCWKCATPKGVAPVATPETSPVTAEQIPPWRLTFKIFRGSLASWEELFTKAAQFATKIGSERVHNISHSADHSDGVVTVWYWTNDIDRK
jgi:hypothetical protein